MLLVVLCSHGLAALPPVRHLSDAFLQHGIVRAINWLSTGHFLPGQNASYALKVEYLILFKPKCEDNSGFISLSQYFWA